MSCALSAIFSNPGSRVAQQGSQYQAKEQDEGRGPVILHVSINPRQ